jgi:hypothetical protein
MKFSLTQALFCLFTLSPAICSAKPYIQPYGPSTPNTLDLSDSGVTTGYDASTANTHDPWAKRVPAAEVILSKKPQWGNTWFGYTQEPPNSGWKAHTIREMTRQAYDSRKHVQEGGFVLAAVWVPGEGVWFGSTVQGAGHNTFKAQAQTLAPELARAIGTRTFSGTSQSQTPALFHAEDAALFWYESRQLQGARPDPYCGPVRMYIYGHRFPGEPAGALAPCGTPNASIRPSCYDVVRTQLDVMLM